MTKDEALRLAVHTMESVLANHRGAPVLPWIETYVTIKAALETPPENYIYGTPLLDAMTKDCVPLQRTWVGLTDEEYKELHLQMGAVYFYQDYGRAIEAKLKELNNA